VQRTARSPFSNCLRELAPFPFPFPFSSGVPPPLTALQWHPSQAVPWKIIMRGKQPACSRPISRRSALGTKRPARFNAAARFCETEALLYSHLLC